MSEAVNDMVAFSKMTDSVLEQIRISEDPKLKKAQEILRRIQTRQLYTCVGQSYPESTRQVKRVSLQINIQVATNALLFTCLVIIESILNTVALLSQCLYLIKHNCEHVWKLVSS